MIKYFNSFGVAHRLPGMMFQGIGLCVAWTFLTLCGTAGAEPVDYFADRALATTWINTSSINGQGLSLEAILNLVESQTHYRFVYVSTRIPIDGKMVIEPGSTESLAQLFSNLSSLANVIFQRHGSKIVVRAPQASPGVPDKIGAVQL
jgi:hypothetical protein